MPKTLTSNEAPAGEADSSSHRELSKMIDAGRAFSGNERNCFFLNTGDGEFATASFGSGLDFPDDGRAVAICDWDHDGDLDLWISNRNAPRLRLMRNDSATTNRSVTLRLVGNGTTSNRDAIGSRVELETEGGLKQIATLRAGEGFLAQSAKAIHFGLGSVESVSGLKVRWPDGSEERFDGAMAGGRYLIRQGGGGMEEIGRRGEIEWQEESDPQDASSAGIRAPAVSLLKMPRINLKKGDGTRAVHEDRHTLILLWASWCPDCLEEMREMIGRQEKLSAVGIEVLALNVDGFGGEEVPPGRFREVIDELKFDFPSAKATKPLLEILQGLHDSTVGLNRSLPVPSSFLVDPQGRLGVIYKGPVQVEQVLSDVSHASGSLEERFVRAAGVEGTLIEQPLVRAKFREQESRILERFGRVMDGAKDAKSAIYYYSQALGLDPGAFESAKKLAELHHASGNLPGAIAALKSAIAAKPADGGSHYRLAQLLARTGKGAEARNGFGRALEAEPGNALFHFGFAAFLDSSGEHQLAVKHYRSGLSIQPANKLAKNNLAWILATSWDSSVRDPRAALKMARELNEATGGGEATILDTLAAAEAGSGDFERAVLTTRRAIRAAAGGALVTELQKRLELFEAGKAYFQVKPDKR